MGSSFRHRGDDELRRLADEALIDYIHLARRAGNVAEAKRGLEVLVYRHAPNVRRRVSIKVADAHTDDVAQEALISAITSAFDGTSKGEFFKWLHTIVARRIADFHRKGENKPSTVPLVEENADDEARWGEQLQSRGPDAAEVDLRLTIEDVLEDFSELHQHVIDLYCFDKLPANEVADEINAADPPPDPPMTENNVQQIGSRFRKRLRKRLADSDTS